MDVERTMEFILHSQAKAEARADPAEQRMDRPERALAPEPSRCPEPGARRTVLLSYLA